MVAKGIFEVGHHATVRGAVGMIFHDIAAVFHHGPSDTDPGGQGELRVRDDVVKGRHAVVRLLQAATPTTAPPGAGDRRQPAAQVRGDARLGHRHRQHRADQAVAQRLGHWGDQQQFVTPWRR